MILSINTVVDAETSQTRSAIAASILSDLEDKVTAAGLKDVYSDLPLPTTMKWLQVSYPEGSDVSLNRRQCIPECLLIGSVTRPASTKHNQLYVHWPKDFYKLIRDVPMLRPTGSRGVESAGLLGRDVENGRVIDYVEFVEPFNSLRREWTETDILCTWYALLAWYVLSAGFDDQSVDWSSGSFEKHFLAALTAIRDFKEGSADLRGPDGSSSELSSEEEENRDEDPSEAETEIDQNPRVADEGDSDDDDDEENKENRRPVG
jgi:hypothetical protein